MVLKGGNAISLVYGFGNRASLDLDFSIENDFQDVDQTERRILTALDQKFSEIGYTVFDKKFGRRPEWERATIPPRWGGYQLEFKLIEKSRKAAFQATLKLSAGMRLSSVQASCAASQSI